MTEGGSSPRDYAHNRRVSRASAYEGDRGWLPLNVCSLGGSPMFRKLAGVLPVAAHFLRSFFEVGPIYHR